MATKTPPKYLSEPELADYFGIPRRVVAQKARSGEWPHYTIGGDRVFELAEVVRLAIGVDEEGGDHDR
jgi:hypothetical protein